MMFTNIKQRDVMTQEQAIEELKKFKELLDINAISQEEFDAKKAELMPLLMAKKTINETYKGSPVPKPSTKNTAQKNNEDSSSGCLVFGIIALVVFIIIAIAASSGSSSSNSPSKAKEETSFSDVKTISQYDFEKRLKKVLRDPDSYQRIEYTVEHVSGDNYKATLTFRARNGFGGMNISTYQGDLIWEKGSSSYSLGHIKEIE